MSKSNEQTKNNQNDVVPIEERGKIGKTMLFGAGMKAWITGDEELQERIEAATGEAEPQVNREYRDIEPALNHEENQIESIAPSVIHGHPIGIQLGKTYCRAYWTQAWPDDMNSLALAGAAMVPSRKNDISIHVQPFDNREDALDTLDERIEYLKESVRNSRQSSIDFESRLENANSLRERVYSNNERLFNVGMFTLVRSPSESEINDISRDVKRQLQDEPARTKQKIGSYTQKKLAKSISPNGRDYTEDYHKRFAISSGVTKLFPFVSAPFVEYEGVLLGQHAYNNSPVIYDIFDAPNGFNTITFGMIGGGKSFGSKLFGVLRMKARYDDSIIIMCDPLEDDFANFRKIVGAERITVGGSQPLNPLKIEPSDEDVVEKLDKNPLRQKVEEVVGFLGQFFNDIGQPLDETEREVVTKSILKSYANNNITEKVSTHDNQSPTLLDVFDILKEMQEDYSPYTDVTLEEQLKKRQSSAANLVGKFEVFKEGRRYHNLAQQSEVNLFQNDLLYLDISSDDGEGGVGTMTQVIIQQVYELAKSSDRPVVFIMDEAHVLLGDEETKRNLNTITRHSRHYDLRLHFITQEIDDFVEDDIAQGIINNCSTVIFHKIRNVSSSIKNYFNLTEEQVNFIEEAKSGGQGSEYEAAYSEALVQLDEYDAMVPINVLASDFETEIIEYEEGDEEGVFSFLD